MAKSPNDAKSLSEAIARLEAIGRSAGADLKERLGTDYQQVLDTLETLKPHLESLKNAAGEKVSAKKTEVEHQVKQNPWLIIGVIGVLALVVGWFIGQNRGGSDAAPSDTGVNS